MTTWRNSLVSWIQKLKDRLKDPSIDHYSQNDFFKHVSMNKLIEPDKDVSDKNSQLPNFLAPIIQRHRIDQQNKKLRGDRRTIVWTSKGEQKNVKLSYFT